MSNKQKVMSNEQKLMSNEQKLMSNEQKVMTNKQNEQKVQPHSKRSTQNFHTGVIKTKSYGISSQILRSLDFQPWNFKKYNLIVEFLG